MSTDLDLLRTADRESAAAFFAAAPAEGLVAATPDDRLVELLGRPQVRAAPEPGDRRQVVGRHRGHGGPRPRRRWVVLEPQQPVREHVVCAEDVASRER